MSGQIQFTNLPIGCFVGKGPLKDEKRQQKNICWRKPGEQTHVENAVLARNYRRWGDSMEYGKK